LNGKKIKALNWLESESRLCDLCALRTGDSYSSKEYSSAITKVLALLGMNCIVSWSEHDAEMPANKSKKDCGPYSAGGEKKSRRRMWLGLIRDRTGDLLQAVPIAPKARILPLTIFALVIASRYERSCLHYQAWLDIFEPKSLILIYSL
jgi:hypothetical protein